MRRECEPWPLVVSFPCNSNWFLVNTVHLDIDIINIRIWRKLWFFGRKFISWLIFFQINFQLFDLSVFSWKKSFGKYSCFRKLDRHWRVEERFGTSCTLRRSNGLCDGPCYFIRVVEKAIFGYHTLVFCIIVLAIAKEVLLFLSEMEFSTLEAIKRFVYHVNKIAFFIFFQLREALDSELGLPLRFIREDSFKHLLVTKLKLVCAPWVIQDQVAWHPHHALVWIINLLNRLLFIFVYDWWVPVHSQLIFLPRLPLLKKMRIFVIAFLVLFHYHLFIYRLVVAKTSLDELIWVAVVIFWGVCVTTEAELVTLLLYGTL